MMRRILALLMALVILLGSMPVQAFAAEELGLPIHFFVSTLEEAQDPYGDYENYKQSSWGSSNSTAGAYAVADILEQAPSIATRQGIRAHMVEEDILKYVAQWPNGGTADDFRKFNGSIQVGRTNYSGDEYEVQWVTICKRDNSSLRCYCGVSYEHIHIDGILTKKIQITPGTMSLTKEISTAQSEDQTFTFKLYQLALDTNYDPTNEIIGSGTPMIATVPAGSTTATITPADPTATFGFGYYKLVEDPNSTWKQSGIRIGNGTNRETSDLYICIHTDGSVQYSTSYNTGYQTADNATVVNTLRPRADIKVTKVWDDANNQDGIRPESIQVHLLKNDAHLGSPVTLNAANNWTATWNVPLEDENGNSISYHVEEVVPNGYTNTVTGNVTDGFVLTNTHVVERTNVQTQKVWHDDSNRDGLRPHGVVVQLYKNGEAVTSYTDSKGNTVSGTATLTESVQWAHQWLDLEKNTGGTANAYTVKEIGYVDANGQTVANPGYTAGYSTDETGRLVVENTHQVATMDIPVQKVWSDANNQDGIRPGSVKVTLYANGASTGETLTLNAANNWKDTFAGVPVNSAGTPISYSIVEEDVTGYETAITGTAATGFTVTNTHVPETISVPVNKVWNDAEDQDGKRPTSITVALYADDVATGDTLVLSAANNWTGAFTGKAKFKAGAVGAAIVYTVQETVVPTGYTVGYNGTTITNTHTPATTDLTVHKVWNDFGDNDGMRADSVTVTLYVNGTATQYALTLNDSNNWTGTWQDMPLYHGGQQISYSVVETSHVDGTVSSSGIPEGYSVEYSYTSTDTEWHATVMNSYTPATTGLNIQKDWADDNNREGLRPAYVTVTLYQQIGSGTPTVVTDSDGNPVTAVLSPENEWDVTFTGLPLMTNQQRITYSVVETPVAGYTTTYIPNADNSIITVKNSHTVNRDITVTASKIWNDSNNQDGLRPATVTLTLYANGIKTTDVTVDGVTIPASITLDGVVDAYEPEPWKAAWSGLYEYYRGQKIVYTVVEETVPTGYTVEITGSNNNYTVTNTHIPETLSIPVTKVWSDTNDQDGLRPEELTVTLYINNVAGRTMVLSESSNWTGSFDNLPKYSGGQLITYTVGEAVNDIPSGYTAAVTGDVVNGFTITNTHETLTTSVTVRKAWNDNGNQDGKRPTSVVVHLLANGEHMGTSYAVTLDASGNWTYTWSDLDMYCEGLKINYTVYEEAVGNGYSATYTRDANDVVIVTNTRSADKTTYTVQKIWNDTNNQDNLRPYAVLVQLYANNTAVGSPVTLTAADHWRTTWTDLDVNRAGSTIVYRAEEVGYIPAEGDQPVTGTVPYYSIAYGTDPTTGIATITNTHEVQKTSVTVSKVWNDANNQDGIRPGSITVTLYRNGVATNATATLNESNGWTYTFANLDVHHGIGVDNIYTVAESGVPAGYTSVTTGDAATGYTITNTHVPSLISIPVQKVWNDSNNQDGKRPGSVTITLYADGIATAQTLVLNAGNNWSGSFADLSEFKAGAVGQRITYTVVEETVPAGYTAAVTGSATDGFTVTNSHTPEKVDIKVTKVWNDNSNQDGKRPTSVGMHLLANGDHVTINGTEATAILDASGSWTYTWVGLDKYLNGQEINYTVFEAPIGDGYSAAYNRSGNEVTVTNTRNTDKTAYTVQKIWKDDNNREGIRPYGVIVQLYADNVAVDGTSVTLTAENHWRTTWTDLDVNKSVNSQSIGIVYSVKEIGYVDANGNAITNPGYSTSYGTDTTGIATITNTHTITKTSVEATKVWVDTDNQDGIRPGIVTLALYANGINANASIVLDGIADSNGESAPWVATWSDLYAYYQGSPVVYTVMEETVPNGYSVAVTGDAATDFTVTNTHVPEQIDIPVIKIWEDANDQDGKRPDSVTITLYADGTSTGKVLTLNAANSWKGTFEDISVNNAGTPIAYSIVENVVTDYTTAITGTAATGFTVTNTHEIEKTAVSVNKVWNDGSNQDGKRPTSVAIHLYANGIHIATEALSDANGWAHTWSGLDKYADGLEINYTVYEVPVGNGYTVKYARSGNNVTVTNSRSVEKTNYTVQKVWSDTNNQDNLRPYAVLVQLYADSIAIGNPVAITAADHWRTTWTALDVNRAGSAINYKAEEVGYILTEGGQIVTGPVPGYTSSIGSDSDTGIATITNTHEVQKTSVTVTKLWDDTNNQDGIRPDSVTVILYRNGVPTATTATLNAANSWTYTFANLDVHHGIGIDSVYTVVESGVPAGYTSVTTGNAATGYTITNTHAPEVVSVTAHKNWVDGNDQDGKRPDRITVALLADGVATGATVELSVSNNWTATFDNLPKYKIGAIGDEVAYTVQETDVPDGYTANVSGNIITNTHTPETADLTVHKLWNDFGNNDGKRPTAVVITLYRNGVPILDPDNNNNPVTVTLNDANSWTGVWQDMPRYHNGQRISYTVVETGYYKTEADFNAGQLTNGIPEGYTVTHSYDTNSSEGLATITNSYTPELTDLNVQKVWNDDDNRDGIRPQSLTVTLYRKIGANGTWAPVLDSNNEKVTAVMNPANEWDVSFTNLPKYSNGVEIIYNAVEETVPTGYTNNGDDYHFDPATRMVTITNTHEVARVNVSATKVWDDNNNQDGIRPEKVVLTLYANGIKTSSTVTLDGVKDTTTDAYRETDAWKATWSNLLAYYHGQKIVYTVVEETVPAGYTAEVTGSAENGFTVTNSHEPALISIPVTKTWDDADNQDGIRPSEVKITLYADGAAIDTLTLKASENWMGSFGELPVNKNGTPIVYTVKEATTVGYTPAYSADTSVAGVQTMQVKNTHETYETKLTVTKVWDDNNDQDGRRPDSIVVHLLADGDHTGMKVTLTADMNWTYTWTGLDKYSAGQEIVYTVYEEPVYFKGISASGNARALETYFASYAHNPEDATEVIITNTYIPETTIITAIKVWEDDGNRDDLRSEKVTVELYADGVATGKTLTLNEANNWEAAWENLPKYKDHGTAIVYSVVENNVPNGYTVTIAQESEYAPGLFIVSNVHSPALTDITVSKVWNDANNNDGIRPGAVTVTLMADGKALYTAQLSNLSDWTHSWKGLYKYADGKEIKYTVVETAVDGYTASYKQVSDANGNAAWTVTNTHEIETAELVVTTVWVDDNDSQEVRPDEVPVQLYKDGDPYGDVFKIIVEEDWQKTIVVPVFEDGKEIVWTVEQVETPNPYTVTYNQGKLTIINTALFDDSPATGDASNPVLLVCLMTVSCAGIAAILILGRKRKHTDA